MKIEIINKAMICWDDDESYAREYHVLAKVTECSSTYPYKVVCNENSYPENPECAGSGVKVDGFKNAKPLPETIELTMAELNKLLGKNIKIIK
jgi:hypothetical protein